MKSFAAKVEEGVKGEDGKPSVGPVYRNILSEKGFPPRDSDITTTWDIFSKSVDKFPDNNMLGWRQIVDEKVGPYSWKTYREVYYEVVQIGSALRAVGAEHGCRVGIYGANCPQWIIAMEACAAHTLICVPLYDTLGPGAVDYIVDHAEIDFVFVQNTKIKGLLEPECKSAKRLKAIVSFTNVSEEQSHKASEIGVKAYSWLDFLYMLLFIGSHQIPVSLDFKWVQEHSKMIDEVRHCVLKPFPRENNRWKLHQYSSLDLMGEAVYVMHCNNFDLPSSEEDEVW